jgi:hypothetical protein
MATFSPDVSIVPALEKSRLVESQAAVETHRSSSSDAEARFHDERKNWNSLAASAAARIMLLEFQLEQQREAAEKPVAKDEKAAAKQVRFVEAFENIASVSEEEHQAALERVADLEHQLEKLRREVTEATKTADDMRRKLNTATVRVAELELESSSQQELLTMMREQSSADLVKTKAVDEHAAQLSMQKYKSRIARLEGELTNIKATSDAKMKEASNRIAELEAQLEQPRKSLEHGKPQPQPKPPAEPRHGDSQPGRSLLELRMSQFAKLGGTESKTEDVKQKSPKGDLVKLPELSSAEKADVIDSSTPFLVKADDFPLNTDIIISNKLTNHCLCAQKDLNWQAGVDTSLPTPASPASVGSSAVWRITKCFDGVKIVSDNSFQIVNVNSNRALYAKKDQEWEEGVGAVHPPLNAGAEGLWDIVKDGDGFRIVNHSSQRSLYAQIPQPLCEDDTLGAATQLPAPGLPQSASIWYIRRQNPEEVAANQPKALPMFADADAQTEAWEKDVVEAVTQTHAAADRLEADVQTEWAERSKMEANTQTEAPLTIEAGTLTDAPAGVEADVQTDVVSSRAAKAEAQVQTEQPKEEPAVIRVRQGALLDADTSSDEESETSKETSVVKQSPTARKAEQPPTARKVNDTMQMMKSFAPMGSLLGVSLQMASQPRPLTKEYMYMHDQEQKSMDAAKKHKKKKNKKRL